MAQDVLFADVAIRLGQAFIDDGTLGPSTMLELQQFQLRLQPPPSPTT
jgi:hypothetical protein